ncbi:uncharacterized protein [Littorina saxatilis]
MPGGWVQRCLLISLHVCGGVAASGALATALLQSHLDCLPPVTDVFGDPLSASDSLARACEVLTYSSGMICGLNLLMAVTLNCCWGSRFCSFMHQVMTLLMCLVSTGNGTALTVDFILWCDSLQNHVSDHSGCKSAAKTYDNTHDSSNMTDYFNKMEMQQACQWAVVPFTLCAVIVYSVVMNTQTQSQNGRPHAQRGRYYLFREDESAPLVRETQMGGSHHQNGGCSDVAPRREATPSNLVPVDMV